MYFVWSCYGFAAIRWRLWFLVFEKKSVIINDLKRVATVLLKFTFSTHSGQRFVFCATAYNIYGHWHCQPNESTWPPHPVHALVCLSLCRRCLYTHRGGATLVVADTVPLVDIQPRIDFNYCRTTSNTWVLQHVQIDRMKMQNRHFSLKKFYSLDVRNKCNYSENQYLDAHNSTKPYILMNRIAWNRLKTTNTLKRSLRKTRWSCAQFRVFYSRSLVPRFSIGIRNNAWTFSISRNTIRYEMLF